MVEQRTHDEDLIRLAQALIQIPSPTGQERAIAEYIRSFLAGVGFEAMVNERETVIGILRNGDGPVIVLDAHIDTVEADASEWTYPPDSGVVVDGMIYGRGASDMKGALAAMLHAARRLAEDRRSWRGTLIISGTSWEEFFEGHTLGKALEELSLRGIHPDYVIIGEASELNIKRGQRGRTRVYCDVKGRAAHSAHPEEGINAVYQALVLIEGVRALSLPQDDFLGDGIVALIGMHSLPQPVDSVIPYQCRVSYDLRLLPGETKDSVLSRFQTVIKGISQSDPAWSAEVSIAAGELLKVDGTHEIVEAFPLAWKIPEDHPLVVKALEATRSVGLKPVVTKYDFCTNGSYSAGVAGIPTIGFGPGKETTAHIVDEYVEIAQLVKACEGYVAIVQHLSGDR